MASNVAADVPNVFKVQYTHSIGSATNIMNRMFFAFTGMLDYPTADALATKAATQWGTHIAPNVTDATKLELVTITDLTTKSSAKVESPQNQLGTIPSATFLPAQDCMLMRGVISRRYRGGKPRMYWSGLVQANAFDNQQWSGTVVTLWQTAINGIVTGMQTGAVGPLTVGDCVNLSFISGYSWHEHTTASGNTVWKRYPIYRTSVTPDPITTWQASPRISSQRRRGVN